MNIALENKFEKINKTLILLVLVSMIAYSLYNVFSYKPASYYKPVEKTYITAPATDTIYPLQ